MKPSGKYPSRKDRSVVCAIAGAMTSIDDIRSEVGKMSLGEDFECITDTSLTTSFTLMGASTFNDEPVCRRIHCTMNEAGRDCSISEIDVLIFKILSWKKSLRPWARRSHSSGDCSSLFGLVWSRSLTTFHCCRGPDASFILSR